MTKKTAFLFASVVFLCFLLGACAGTALPDGFTEADVLASAENVITLLSCGEYEAVADTFSTQMAQALDAEGLEAAIGSRLDALGGFGAFKSRATTGKSDAVIGDFAVAVIVCSYENGTATYTISIDENGNVCGLYMK